MISITNTKGDIKINSYVELDNRKSKLYVSSTRAKQKITRIHNSLKNRSSYSSVYLGYDQIDWYDSCDSYEVPSFYFKKGNRTVCDCYESYNDIPKDWEEVISIRLVNCKRYGVVMECLSLLGISLSDKEERELRKCLRDNTEWEKD
jgi:hypothetical protein